MQRNVWSNWATHIVGGCVTHTTFVESNLATCIIMQTCLQPLFQTFPKEIMQNMEKNYLYNDA